MGQKLRADELETTPIRRATTPAPALCQSLVCWRPHPYDRRLHRGFLVGLVGCRWRPRPYEGRLLRASAPLRGGVDCGHVNPMPTAI